MYDEKLAEKVHEENLAERSRIDAAFEEATKEQPRIEARRRDAIDAACSQCSEVWVCPRCACGKAEGSRHPSDS